MATEIEPVKIPAALRKVIGEPDEGTRLYRRDGQAREFRQWSRALFQTFPRGLMSPGGAARYAGVSRAALHKAIVDGRLTCFAFHEVKEIKSFFGKRQRRENPYLYVPLEECRQWFLILSERLLRSQQERQARGQVVDEKILEQIRAELTREITGDVPNWDAVGINQPLKKRKPPGRSGGQGKLS